jgi:hypothetical protein
MDRRALFCKFEMKSLMINEEKVIAGYEDDFARGGEAKRCVD